MASQALKIGPEKKNTAGALHEPSEDSGQRTLSEGLEGKGVSALAYLFWEERGCPIGSPQEDWFRAEETFKKRG